MHTLIIKIILKIIEVKSSPWCYASLVTGNRWFIGGQISRDWKSGDDILTWSWSSDAQYGWLQKGEWQLAMKPYPIIVENGCCLFSDSMHLGQSTVEDGCESSHAIGGTKHKGSKWSIFYLKYSLLVGSLLLSFMVSEARCKSKLLIGLCKGVKHIHVGTWFLSMCPEVSGSYIHSGLILMVRCCIIEDFSTQCLEDKFKTDIVTDLC